MDSQPPVTAVVPTHRRPALMRAAVQSIVDQSYRGQIDIIVVFDACDPTLPDVSLPPNRSISAEINNRTRGLAGARNTGILAATNSLVAFLDDDDEWFPAKLEKQITALAENPHAVLMATAIVVFDGHRRIERLAPVERITHAELLRDRMAGVHSSSFMFDRSALLGGLGLIDEELPGSYGEDYDILLRAAEFGDIFVVNEPLVLVRWQGQSFFFGKWDQYAIALDYLLIKHPAFQSDRRAIARIWSQIAFAQAASGQTRAARATALNALRKDPTRVRAFLALAISFRIISADTVAKAAQRVGKGI